MQTTIGLIGAGNMGMAILKGIAKKFKVLVCEKDSVRAEELKKKFKLRSEDFRTVVNKSQIIILAVKPQDFDGILEELAQPITQKQLVISIAAGITTSYIEKKIGQGIRVIRAMPNLPAQVGQGMTALCKGKKASDSDLSLAKKIFDCVGKTVLIEEQWMDAVTAVSGSGPAYVFYFMECFQKAALSLGLSEKVSQELVIETLKGSLALLQESKEDVSILRQKVTSKGGTTEAAFKVLDQNKFNEIFIQAIKAARDRAGELAK